VTVKIRKSKGAKAKVVTDATTAGKGAGKATKAIGKNVNPAGGKPDGNPTPLAKKGSPSKKVTAKKVK